MEFGGKKIAYYLSVLRAVIQSSHSLAIIASKRDARREKKDRTMQRWSERAKGQAIVVRAKRLGMREKKRERE